MSSSFELTTSSSEAYKVFREIMQMYGGEDAKWDEALLDSARGSQVRRFTLKFATITKLRSFDYAYVKWQKNCPSRMMTLLALHSGTIK